MRYASVQYSILYQQFLDSNDTFYPEFGYPLKQDWVATGPTNGWTAGFFSGVFWNLVQYNVTEESLKRAEDVTAPIAPFANRTGGIDIGFVIMPSFGNGYHILKRPEYLDAMINSAYILGGQYSAVLYCRRPSLHNGSFSIYIDNIMNLELLFEVSNLTKNQTLYDIAWQYANITMYEGFRENNSTYHIVEYNRTNCNAIRKYTRQG